MRGAAEYSAVVLSSSVRISTQTLNLFQVQLVAGACGYPPSSCLSFEYGCCLVLGFGFWVLGYGFGFGFGFWFLVLVCC